MPFNLPDLFCMDLIRQIRNKMMADHLVFVYRGGVTAENSVLLLSLLEKEMDNSEFGLQGRKRLFMFVLESLQNVSKHGDQDKSAKMSLVVYSRHNGGYTVTTGNVIDSANVNDLKMRLTEIKKLSPDEIKAFYRQLLVSTEFNKKGGAGLGLIEMARKTGNKLDFDFITLNKDYSYYVLSKTVDSEGLGVFFGDKEKPFSGVSAIQMEDLMSENNICLIWSGHISPDIGKEVLSFAETRLNEDDVEANLRRRVFIILVEILENVSKYAAGREPEEKFGMPIAIVGLDGDIFSLTTGNLILNTSINELKGKLDIINMNDRSGLEVLYKSSLFSQTFETDSTDNLGLIEMSRKSGSKLDYQFEKVNDLYSYFMLTVKVTDLIF